MTLPTKEKTWLFDVNNVGGSSAGTLADTQGTLYAIKVAMVALGWTVVSSSDSTAPGTGLGDNWAASGNLIWGNAGVAHSWIVLEQSGINANFQVCFDCGSAATYLLNVGVSPVSGYNNDGTNTNRPTAPDEYLLRSVALSLLWGVPNGASASKVHVMCSDDGECTRILICNGGGIWGFYAFDKPKTPSPGWSDPWIACGFGHSGAGGDMTTYAALNDNPNFKGDPASGGRLVNMYLTSEAYLSQAGGKGLTVADDQSGEWPMFSAGLLCLVAGNRGRKGAIFDLWWGSTTIANGDTYPAAGTNLYAQFGDLIFPWDGSAPQIA